MNRQRLEELTDHWRDGCLTEAQASELNQTLRESEEARRFFRAEAQLHGLLHCAVTAAAVVEASAHLSPQPASTRTTALRSSNWLQWRPVTAAAAGLVIGLSCASAVWALALPRGMWSKGDPLPLAEGGFESGQRPGEQGVPVQPGLWSGDFSAVSAGENGITPSEGRRMLKFLRADNRLTPPGVVPSVAEMWQVVELAPLRGSLGRGVATVELAARFNATRHAASERVAFGITACAFAGSAADTPELWRGRREMALAEASKEELAESDPGTWQSLSAQVCVPPEATLLLVQLLVTRKGKGPHPQKFDGYFVDSVTLHVTDSASPAVAARR